MLSLLTQAKLVRVNRASLELEPWLAERWDSSADGLSHTLYLRNGLQWSDGTPFTADDVTFSFKVGTDSNVSIVATSLLAGGQPITATDPDSEAAGLFREVARAVDEDLAPRKRFRPELKIR